MYIECSHVSKRFTDSEKRGWGLFQGQAGLLDFTATLKGGVTAVLGPPSSGKSTLLQIIAAFSVPDDGRVTYQFADHCSYVWSRRIADMGDMSTVELLQQRIGYVPSNKLLHPDDMVLEDALLNLSYYHRLAQPKRRVVEMITRWGLAAYRKGMLVELPEYILSRYAIAASLLGDPEFWLLDDPTRGLDELGYNLFLHELQQRREKGITIFVTHDLELAELADHLLLMESGFCRRIGERRWMTSGVPDGSVASWYQLMQRFFLSSNS
ncbi:ATP-binding cassette domain-containing protein [Melghirimyces algeriensis]|uniref:Putative ABC transport system ATP-binding protein/polar amino acid transport system ATP-binding protein n=1 Tax=Melghirimyces algeriensis TaxID=910412 RepID=A0A521DLF6_9BACL|nr:ATP-binding cassette domain-containing protein [Melghirimyces algeriensis]SMO71770.1 putative ABC transport system ATP-binding protein/polar amino acid transport system ATP-binding protein [Melghirimyces algeriensis]